MNSNKFPKLDISKALSMKVQCSEHEGFIESICSFPSCEFQKMLCPQCKLKNPEHLKQHQNYFKKPEDMKKTLQNENDEFHKIVNDSIIIASDSLDKNLESLLEKELERLNKFFNDFSQKIVIELENVKTEIYSQLIKKYFTEVKDDFHDYFSERFHKFNENTLIHFLHFYKLSENNGKISSKDFENMVNLVFNSRIVAIQLNNLKDEKVKSIMQNIPKLENLNSEDFLKKISAILMNSFKNMYYPGSALISPTKQTQNAFIGRIPLKKGCTFEEKANTFEKEEEEEYGLKLSKMNEEEINNKISIDNLAEATKILLSKGISNEDLEISISLPITERQDKEMEILGRVFHKMSQNGKNPQKLDIDCASKSQGRRSVAGGISDEGLELFAKGLGSFDKTLENLRLDFSLNGAISDCGIKILLGVVKKLNGLKNINLEFYMDTKITDKILEDIENLKDLPNIEEILINFTKTRVTKELAEKTIALLKKKPTLKKIEIFANI